jgi:LmbE family N-acetylglucosaminyl deacetylase
VGRLARILDEVRPDTVLSFGPDVGTFHPDHIALCSWVGDACRKARAPGRILQEAVTDEQLAQWGELLDSWGVYMSDERPVGVPVADLALDVRLTGAVLDQKITALCATYSQVAPALAAVGEKSFRALNSRETFVAA